MLMYLVQRTGRPAGEEKDVTVPCTEDREARRRRIRCKCTLSRGQGGHIKRCICT
jgi:hypothetical protein